MSDLTLPSEGSDRRQFHIKSCLGRGGFGEVYRATMTGAGGVRIEVAVKVLHAEVDPESQAIQRLKDEARVLGAVHHPSVLAVHGLTLLDGRVALITEYVEGADLDKCAAGDQPIGVRALLEMVGKVAEALSAAYEAPAPDGSGAIRLVHRDIKPANIRLGRHGEVKLLDFGIARASNLEREARTETNAMLGSYLYMAPERFLEGGEQGPEVDVFALGCTFYECLVHKRLFGEMTLKEMYLLILEPQKYDAYVTERLGQMPRSLPHQVTALLHRMVELQAKNRPNHKELARVAYELADRLPGPSLDKWARQRSWPTPRLVRGMLDGTVITETGFSASKHEAMVGRLSGDREDGTVLLPTGSDPSRPRGRVLRPNETFEGVLDLARQTASATFERPAVAFGMGISLAGITVGVASVGVGVLGVAALAWWWLTADPGGLEVAHTDLPPVAPAVPALPDGAVAAPVALAPSPEPASDTPARPRPRPAPRSSASRPAPAPAPAPSAEPAPAPAPAVVPAKPAPAPAPTVPDEPVVVNVEANGVLVKFKGKDGIVDGRRLEPGLYEVVAYFEGGVPEVQAGTKVSITPGGTYTVTCSKLARSCRWK